MGVSHLPNLTQVGSKLTTMEHELWCNMVLEELLEDGLAEGREEEKLQFLGQTVKSFVGGSEERDGR